MSDWMNYYRIKISILGSHISVFKWTISAVDLCNKYCARHILGIGNKLKTKTNTVLHHEDYFPERGERKNKDKNM